MADVSPVNIKVLGCCHKVCGECWAHWQAIKHGRGFCLLCKHEEFLGDVCEGDSFIDIAAAPVGGGGGGGGGSGAAA